MTAATAACRMRCGILRYFMNPRPRMKFPLSFAGTIAVMRGFCFEGAGGCTQRNGAAIETEVGTNGTARRQDYVRPRRPRFIDYSPPGADVEPKTYLVLLPRISKAPALLLSVEAGISSVLAAGARRSTIDACTVRTTTSS
jgi:hypothetical protein